MMLAALKTLFKINSVIMPSDVISKG